MAEPEYSTCPVCGGKTHRSETDFTFDTGACFRCFPGFVADCFEDWQRKEVEGREVIGGYRRAELAYYSGKCMAAPTSANGAEIPTTIADIPTTIADIWGSLAFRAATGLPCAIGAVMTGIRRRMLMMSSAAPSLCPQRR